MSTKALSDYTFVSRYARYNKSMGRRETWHEAVERVKSMHLSKYPMAKDDIDWAFSHVHDMVALGSQRALQFGGEPILRKEARIYNCSAGYCDRLRFFQEATWLLLCGCGVGVSVTKNHVAKLPDFHGGLQRSSDMDGEVSHVVDDSIEGWSDAFGALLSSYLPHSEFNHLYGKRVSFDYSKIRAKGSPLSYGVGKAPGYEPLMNSLEKCRTLLNSCIDSGRRRLRPIDCMDYLLHASDCVLSGGIRRSAVIVLFSPDDMDMMTAKTGQWYYENPQRARSNNSVLLDRKTTTREDFHKLFDSTRQYGEPGMVWTDCVDEQLFNPCNEISLRGYDKDGKSGFQFCNLTEINGSKLTSKENFALAVRVASIIGTLQAGYTKFDYLERASEDITKREALLGVSITGMMDNPSVCFDPSIQREMAGLVLEVNESIARKIGVNKAARATTVKPAGTTSCLLQTASGIHPHHAARYIRRVQSNSMENPIRHFASVNPEAIERSVWSANGTDEVLSFLIETRDGALTKSDVDALMLLERVRTTQENWIEAGKRPDCCVAPWLTHNVSNTINVKDDEWEAVEGCIYEHRKSYAGVSLLGALGDLDYPQAPFTRVLTVEEIVEKYGKGSIFASGLIVDALHAFHGNLWKACDVLLGVYTLQDPEIPEKINDEIMEKIQSEWTHYNLQKDWVRRAKQFAKRYSGGDVKNLTYMIKDVNNNKLWEDLSRTYRDVDYTTMLESDDNTKISETIACSGGSCETIFA